MTVDRNVRNGPKFIRFRFIPTVSQVAERGPNTSVTVVCSCDERLKLAALVGQERLQQLGENLHHKYRDEMIQQAEPHKTIQFSEIEDELCNLDDPLREV